MSAVKISAKEVKKLRDITGAGMMDCKKALKASNGDFEGAIEYLRKKGQKVAAKRQDRAANEGAAIAKTNSDGTKGVVIVLSSETDFVAKNADFIGFATAIADLALANYPANTAELLAIDMDGASIGERVTDMVGKIGEKIEVSKYERLSGDLVVPYIHAGNRIGVLVSLNQAKTDALVEAGKNVAMQVAALSPVAVDESSVDQKIIDKELEIGREQALAEGKPAKIIDRIAQGKLKRFFKDNTLVHQKYVKDSKVTVKEYLNSVSKGLKAVNFKRIAIGK